jgi:hypothetical protein
VTSPRAARCTTNRPTQAIPNAKKAALPHWPGETQALPVAAIAAASAKFVGLKRCLPFHRKRNLLAIAPAPAAAASQAELVRRSRQRESAEISALQGSKAGSRARRVQASWTASAVATRRSARAAVTSKDRTAIP